MTVMGGVRDERDREKERKRKNIYIVFVLVRISSKLDSLFTYLLELTQLKIHLNLKTLVRELAFPSVQFHTSLLQSLITTEEEIVKVMQDNYKTHAALIVCDITSLYKTGYHRVLLIFQSPV